MEEDKGVIGPVSKAMVLVLGLVCVPVGCSQQAATPQPSPSPAVCAPQSASPNGGCLAQGFRMSGELSGTVADAFVETRCPVPLLGERLSPTTMDFRLEGHGYRLVLDPGATTFLEKPITVTQSGTSTLGRLTITDTGVATVGAWESTRGSMSVDASGIAGTLALQLLAQNTSGARPLRLDGSWRCAQAISASSPTPSACSAVLSAQHPEGADMVALAAGTCRPLSLDLSGALAGHADAAVLVAPATDLQSGCIRTGQGLETQFDVAVDGRVVTITVWLRREPLRGSLAAGNYPDPGYLEGIDPVPVAVSTGRMRWAYKSGTVTLGADLAGGTIDADLQGGSPGFGETVHISGAWRCG
jgi:hypothetical protein